jgi:hypothetical protein
MLHILHRIIMNVEMQGHEKISLWPMTQYYPGIHLERLMIGSLCVELDGYLLNVINVLTQ